MSDSANIRSTEVFAETTRGHVSGWRIPDSISDNPGTAIVPLHPDPDMLRATSRVLHTLMVRSCPEALIVVGMHGDSRPDPVVISTGAIQTPLGVVEIDGARSEQVVKRLSGDLEIVPGEAFNEFATDTGLETIPLLIQVLAPGCSVIPLLLSSNAPYGTARSIGTRLAEVFRESSVVLTAALELGSEPVTHAGEQLSQERLRNRDIELIEKIVELDLDGTEKLARGTETGLPGCKTPEVLITAVAHAHSCGAGRGHLIEYCRSDEDQRKNHLSGRAGIVF